MVNGNRSVVMALGVLPFLVVPHYRTWLVALNGFVYHMWFRHSQVVCWYDVMCNCALVTWYNVEYMNTIAFALSSLAFVIYCINKYVWWHSHLLHVVGVQWLILSGVSYLVFYLDG